MSKVTNFQPNELEAMFRDLAMKARRGEVTHAYVLVQAETENFVEWQPHCAGEKSYDAQHLLAQIGHFYVATQAIFEEICQVAEEENDADT